MTFRRGKSNAFLEGGFRFKPETEITRRRSPTRGVQKNRSTEKTEKTKEKLIEKTKPR